jgi:hypothetical protein
MRGIVAMYGVRRGSQRSHSGDLRSLIGRAGVSPQSNRGCFAVSSGRLALGLLLGCARLILSELPQPTRNHPQANGKHDAKHDAVERLVMEHVGIGCQEAVVPEPKRKRDEQDREKEGVIERVRRRAASFGSRLGRGRRARGLLFKITHFGHDGIIAWLPLLGSVLRSSKLERSHAPCKSRSDVLSIRCAE